MCVWGGGGENVYFLGSLMCMTVSPCRLCSRHVMEVVSYLYTLCCVFEHRIAHALVLIAVVWYSVCQRLHVYLSDQ